MNHTNINIHAAILAGGLSSRMGCDKRFLKIDGEHLIDRAIRIASESINKTKDQVLICGNVPGYLCLQDEIPHLGPLSGLISGVQKVISLNEPGPSWIMFLPVDMPLLSVSVLHELLNSIEIKADFESNVVLFENHELPMLLRCDLKTLETLKEIVLKPDPSHRSIRNFVSYSNVKIISGNIINNTMINTNSPNEWLQVCKETDHEHPTR